MRGFLTTRATAGAALVPRRRRADLVHDVLTRQLRVVVPDASQAAGVRDASIVRLFTPAEVRRGTAVHVTSGRQTAFADTTARTRFPTGDHDPSGVLKGLNPCQDT